MVCGNLSAATPRRLLSVALSLSVALIIAVAGPAAGSIEEDAESYIEVNDELSETTTELEAIDAEAQAAGEDLVDARARLADAKDRLERLRTQLGVAIKRQKVAEARLDRMVQALGQATRSLVAAQAAFDQHSADFATEITAAYKYGGDTTKWARTLEALEESGNFNEFLIMEEQLRHGAKTRHAVVEYVAALAADLAEREREVAELKDRAEAAERLAIEHRATVAELTRQQAAVVTSVATERRSIAQLVRKLAAKQQEYTERVAELEAESEALAAELSQHSGVAGALGEDDLMWPTDGGVTSGFGGRMHPIFKVRRMHAGVDIPAPTGQAVYSSAPGVVVGAGSRGGYGSAVVVAHDSGLSTLYAHLSEIHVTVGESVGQLQQVGEVGSTGNSTGPHLHYEVRVNGVPYDPMSWF